MKRAVIRLLRNGHIMTGRMTVGDFKKYLYPLGLIIRQSDDMKGIQCNGNAFWKASNNRNRQDLIGDILAMGRGRIGFNARIHILIRFERGDRYGISDEANTTTKKEAMK